MKKGLVKTGQNYVRRLSSMNALLSSFDKTKIF